MCAKPQYFFKDIYLELICKPEVMEGNIIQMLVVHDESTRGCYVFVNIAQFEAWYKVDKDKEKPGNIPEERHQLHEVIFGFLPQRLKFDIDAISFILELDADTWASPLHQAAPGTP